MKTMTCLPFFLLIVSSLLLQACSSPSEPHSAQPSPSSSGPSDSIRSSLQQEAISAAQKEWDLSPQ
jgi:outer membrane biogenesis lipoprotein LolB